MGELEEYSTSWGAYRAERSSGPDWDHPKPSNEAVLPCLKLLLDAGVLIEDAVLGQTAGKKQRRRPKKEQFVARDWCLV